MLVTRAIRIVAVTAVLMLPGISAVWTSAQTNPPRVFILDAKQLNSDLGKIERDAQKTLLSGPFSVTTKTVTPPSGDKRDYMSQAPYFWPNPATKEGLPYIRRDGERNPEIDKINNHRVLDQMEAAVETLALAYHLKRD
ncbi:MAG TPA: alginate lyase family protein, partial [Pyrinomonadaceae bacterium]|nr:alginate lyase family protein [Pyrinomonadaceae bacterium]